MEDNQDYLNIVEEKSMPEFSDIPFASKRALSTAALFTEVWANYIKKHKCPHLEQQDSDQWVTELLDHVIIVGGFCRDLLLNRPINDIDIMINLRELCKLQTNHLKKYHGDSDKQKKPAGDCLYWKHYLLKNQQQIDKEKLNPDHIAFHEYDHIFNGKFWVKILNEDELCFNKVSLKNVKEHGYFSGQVLPGIQYGGIDLDGQQIDIIDVFSIDKHSDEAIYGDNDKFKEFHRKQRQKSMSGIAINQDLINTATRDTDDDDDDDHDHHDDTHDDYGDNDNDIMTDNEFNAKAIIGNNQKRDSQRVDKDVDEIDEDNAPQPNGGRGGGGGGAGGRGPRRLRKVRLASRAQLDFDLNNEPDKASWGFKTDKDFKFKMIELPIYSGKVRYKLLNYDFSINTAILPFSNIENLKENTLGHLRGGMAAPRRQTWVDAIENGLGECDAADDIYHKILRVPEAGHEHCTIEAHPAQFIFWRVIRWQIRTRDDPFKVERALKRAIFKDCDNWLNAEWFSNKKNCNRFMKGLKTTMRKECKEKEDIEAMLNSMDDLKFTQKFLNVMDENKTDIRYALKDAIYDVSQKIDTLSGPDIVDVLKERGYSIGIMLFCYFCYFVILLYQ